MMTMVATPIGNLADISERALQALREADVLACEDTRRTRILLSHYGIPTPRQTLSYRQGNEARVGERILACLEQGLRVVLCSDGGYPGISDPGYRLARLLGERGREFEVIPGASAVPLALLLSALPTSSYTFKGYPPRKPGPLRRFFAEDADRPHTLVLFESPFRVGRTLAAAREALGNRAAAVCVELTKKFERVHRGGLEELARRFATETIKGEVTIVVAGNHPKFGLPDGVEDSGAV
jgi:16S rRNA (cytidine1402-2'-O)-methyltransferase